MVKENERKRKKTKGNDITNNRGKKGIKKEQQKPVKKEKRLKDIVVKPFPLEQKVLVDEIGGKSKKEE